MAINPVAWFEIYVDDLNRAREFYSDVFAVELEPLGDPNDTSMIMMAFPSNMEQYGASGALVKAEGINAGSISTLVYFGCDDCGVEESRVVAAGGTVERPKMSIGDFGFISLLKDSEGNQIGLHSMS